MQEVEGSTPTGGTCPNDFSDPMDQDIRTQWALSWKIVVSEWRPPYQTDKTVHVHAKHYKHDEDGRTAPGVCGNGSVPLSHSGNVVKRIEIHTHTYLITRTEIHTHTYLSTGRTHGTPYRGYGYVPLRFEGTSLGEWEHNDNLSQYFSRHQRLNISCRS